RLLLAAVDLDHRAVDEMRKRRREIGDKVRALVDLGDATERNRARRELVRLLERELHVARHRSYEARPTLGAHRPRVYRAHADAVLAILRRERLGQVLAGGVASTGHDLPVGLLHAVVADQVDDAAAALLLHDRQHVLQAAHIAHELELQALLPVLLRQRLDHAAGRRAGVVHENVDAPELPVGALDEVLRLGFLREVGRDGEHLAAARAPELVRRFIEHVLAARADRDIAAFAHEGERDALADAFAAAGDAGELALQLQIHRDLLLSWPMLYCENYAPGRG